MAGITNVVEPLGPHHITSTGRYSLVGRTQAFDSVTPGSATYPANDLAIYVPITIPHRFVVARFLWYNGGNLTGNCEAGLYDVAGNKLVGTADTARSGTSTVQFADVTDYVGEAGQYFLAFTSASTTGSFLRQTGSSIPTIAACGVLQEASAASLPSTMTPVALTSNYLPLFGFTQDGTY